MFSESLEGVVTETFSGGFAPRPPHSLLTGQKTGLDPLLNVVAYCLQSLVGGFGVEGH